jgi:transcriptional regulator with XRE-family HTH domain
VAATNKALSPVAVLLREEMKIRGLTYRGLAKFLKVPLSQVHAWANGAEPRMENLRHISRKFRVEMAELVS